MNGNDAKEALLARARAAQDEGESGLAAALLERAVALDPADPATWSWLGHCYADREQYGAAIDAFDRAAAIDPAFAPAHSGRAQVLEAVGRYSEAEASMRHAVKLQPTAARYVLLGDIQAASGRDSHARTSFEEALRLDPSDDEAMFNLALLIRAEEPEKAEGLLRKALEIDPLFSEAHREHGFALARRGDYPGAEHHVRTALGIESSDPWGHLYLANILWSLNRLSEAETEFLQACQKAPLWSVPHWLLGFFYEKTGQAQLARREFELAVENDPKDANAAYHLGKYLADFGFAEEGRKWLLKALELDPNHLRAQGILNNSDPENR
jgi:protein O-GlcNAc transferase